jgi:hypothetical protein
MAKIVVLYERKAKKDAPQPGERLLLAHEYYAMRKRESQVDYEAPGIKERLRLQKIKHNHI